MLLFLFYALVILTLIACGYALYLTIKYEEELLIKKPILKEDKNQNQDEKKISKNKFNLG